MCRGTSRYNTVPNTCTLRASGIRTKPIALRASGLPPSTAEPDSVDSTGLRRQFGQTPIIESNPDNFGQTPDNSVKLRNTEIRSNSGTQKFEFLKGKKIRICESAVLIAFEVTGSQGLSFFYFLFVFKVLIICFDQTGVQNLTDFFSIVSPKFAGNRLFVSHSLSSFITR